MIDQEARDALIDALRATPRQLRELIHERDDAALRRAAPGGGWGVVENFCHLRDIDALQLERVRRIVAEDDPWIPAVDETLWPIERDYAAQHPRIALEQFAENRAAFTHLLDSLPPDAWLRRGHHAELGDQTVRWYADHAIAHDATHVAQIRRLLAIDDGG